MTTAQALRLPAIEAAFANGKAQNRATFMPFFTVGYPTYDDSLAALMALAEAGADAIEIGIPFSDPLADGPTIQHASTVALRGGTRLADSLRAVRTLRQRGIDLPLVLMGYLNPLLNYGLTRFVEEAAEAGASGFIIPDLPPEEATELTTAARQQNLGQIPLVAPNTAPARAGQIAAGARGFIYMVSVTGVTGARDALPPDLAAYISRTRAVTTLPLAVGFGISKPAQAAAVANVADGVIVASALIRLMESEGVMAVKALAQSLAKACQR
jgi:tryptophan synthase alpha chain